MGRPPLNDPEDYIAIGRFLDKCREAKNGCTIWEAGRHSTGYGRFSIHGRPENAHVVAWYFAHGYWPNKFVCHTCDRKLCVNVDHLFLGTPADNVADKMLKGRHGYWRKHKAELREQVRVALMSGRSQRDIAAEFGISQASVSEIHRRKHEPK